MKKILGNRKAVSPVLAGLLFIAIAVGAAVVTYAWVMGFVGTQTQQAGGVLVVDKVTWYNESRGGGDYNLTVALTIRNTGTGRATISVIYWDNKPGTYSHVNETFAVKDVTDTTWDSNSTDTLDIDPGEVKDVGIRIGDGTNTGLLGDTYYIRVVTSAGSRVDVSSTAPTSTVTSTGLTAL